jgi:hypothetical protein
MGFIKNKEKIPFLVKKIKRMRLKNKKDLLLVSKLSKLVHDEWSKLRIKNRAKLMRNKELNKKLYVRYEAEEEVVIGLLSLLHQMMIDFFIQNITDKK